MQLCVREDSFQCAAWPGRSDRAATAVALAAVATVGGGPDGGTPGPTAPSKPFLTVDLERDDAVAAALQPSAEGFLVVVQVSVRGLVPQLTREGSPAAGPDNLLGLMMYWGDGSQGYTPLEHSCVPDAPLVDVDTEFVVQHVYRLPGEYTVTYQTGACEPVRSVTQTCH